MTHSTGEGAPGLFAEDLVVGQRIELGEYKVDYDEIITFAQQWDPQPIHVDASAAAESPFGGVIASGMHTLAIYQRLAVLGAFLSWQVLAGRAIRDVELTAPVRPGDVLSGALIVLSVTANRPDRSLVTAQGSITCGDTAVLTLVSESYVQSNRAP